MTADAPLVVWLSGHRVGLLDRMSAEAYRFRYDEGVPPEYALSLTMPVRGEPYETRILHPVFQQNLPEGALRAFVDDLPALSIRGAKNWPSDDEFIRFARSVGLSRPDALRILDDVDYGIEEAAMELSCYADDHPDHRRTCDALLEKWGARKRAGGVSAMIHRHLNHQKNPGSRVTILPPGALAAWKRRDQERDRRRVAEGGTSMAAVWREIAKTETFEILRDPTMEGLDEE